MSRQRCLTPASWLAVARRLRNAEGQVRECWAVLAPKSRKTDKATMALQKLVEAIREARSACEERYHDEHHDGCGTFFGSCRCQEQKP